LAVTISTVVYEPIPGKTLELPAYHIDFLGNLREQSTTGDHKICVLRVETTFEDVQCQFHRVLLFLIVY